MPLKPANCSTPHCPNSTYRLRCDTCLAQEASHKVLQSHQAGCTHGHSITGDYEMVIRLLPEYSGAHPQPGYMLDVCKECLRELNERPYNASRYRIPH